MGYGNNFRGGGVTDRLGRFTPPKAEQASCDGCGGTFVYVRISTRQQFCDACKRVRRLAVQKRYNEKVKRPIPDRECEGFGHRWTPSGREVRSMVCGEHRVRARAIRSRAEQRRRHNIPDETTSWCSFGLHWWTFETSKANGSNRRSDCCPEHREDGRLFRLRVKRYGPEDPRLRLCVDCKDPIPFREHGKKRRCDECQAFASSDTVKATGLTRPEYLCMMTEQDGRCICCGVHESDARGGKTGGLVIMHVHQERNGRLWEGPVIGLGCGNCNAGSGMMGDDPARLRRMADLIERTLVVLDLAA